MQLYPQLQLIDTVCLFIFYFIFLLVNVIRENTKVILLV